MYCDNCGAKNRKNRKFCKNCGATVGKVEHSDYEKIPEISSPGSDPKPYQPTPPPLPKKSPLWAVLASLLFFPGIGHMYTDKINRGIAILFIWWAVVTTLLILGANVNLDILLYSLPVISLLQIWICIDVFIAARKFNQYVAKHKKKPKIGEKW